MVKESTLRRDLTLDLCRRCGGIWFEPGEFRLLRSGAHVELGTRVVSSPHKARCHTCLAPVGRDAESCPACGAANTIDCPHCCRPTQRYTHDGISLDVCPACRGVWFDRHELSAIWTVAIATVIKDRGGSASGGPGPAGDGAGFLLEALLYTPDVGALVVEGSHEVAGSAIQAFAATPEAAASVVEAAGVVFEALLRIVEAALDGLSL